MNRRHKRYLRTLAILAILMVFPFLWKYGVESYYNGSIYNSTETPSEKVAVVFGAAVYGNGRLSAVLRDRMETAIGLYNAGVVQKLLVSGDNRFDHYDEPGAMMAYAIQRGVPEEDIHPDYAGRRTYDTCYRARHVFGVDSAVLVTQNFHLPRALFICNSLGVKSVGTSADLRPYRGTRWYKVRETGATLLALWDVMSGKQAEVLGEPLPIQ
ncbi:MAG: SanA/YdcF family protein [Ardenticatenaceae bacterium]